MLEVRVESSLTLEVKQSKFITFILPIELLDKRLSDLKLEHPKARHFIVAWRRLNEFEQTLEYSTDDGEPKGTSGRPVLNVLRGVELINSAVIVVRYFGGTKLGTGGLVRAYSDAAKAVIENAELLEFQLRYPLSFTVSYRHNPKIEYLLESQNIVITQKDFQDISVEYQLLVTHKQREFLESYEKSERIIKINKNK